jgi:hypothetical protein
MAIPDYWATETEFESWTGGGIDSQVAMVIIVRKREGWVELGLGCGGGGGGVGGVGVRDINIPALEGSCG